MSLSVLMRMFVAVKDTRNKLHTAKIPRMHKATKNNELFSSNAGCLYATNPGSTEGDTPRCLVTIVCVTQHS